MADAGLAPRVLEEDQREQAEHLGLVGHEDREQLREPRRLVAEVAADELVARRRRVALVEDQVEHGEHRAQALRQQVVGRDAERDARVADLPLRAHEPLRERRLRDEERARDLRRAQTADLVQRQRDARLGRERGVAAGEDEAQPLVGDRAHVVLLLGSQLLESREELGLPRERALAPDAVDRAVSRRRDDPRATGCAACRRAATSRPRS